MNQPLDLVDFLRWLRERYSEEADEYIAARIGSPEETQAHYEATRIARIRDQVSGMVDAGITGNEYQLSPDYVERYRESLGEPMLADHGEWSQLQDQVGITQRYVDLNNRLPTVYSIIVYYDHIVLVYGGREWREPTEHDLNFDHLGRNLLELETKILGSRDRTYDEYTFAELVREINNLIQSAGSNLSIVNRGDLSDMGVTRLLQSLDEFRVRIANGLSRR